MRYDDEKYTLRQRRDYWANWISALVFGCFFFAVVTYLGFSWRSDDDATETSSLSEFVVTSVWLWPVIFLAFVGVWWEQRKKVEKLDKKIKEAERKRVADDQAEEKRAKAAAKKKRAAAKKKRESGQN